MSVIFPSAAPSKNVRESSILAPPRTVITTLFSLGAHSGELRISASQLVALMTDLGIDAPSVRSAADRLKQNGFLLAEKNGTRTIYRLSPHVGEALQESDARILGNMRAAKNDGWILVVFSVPEAERERRHALRTLLVRLGFGNIASAVWIAPITMKAEVTKALSRADLHAFVEIFEVKAIDSAIVKLGSWWNLEQMEQLFKSFTSRWSSALHEDLNNSPRIGKYRIYVLALTDWRKIAYLDPGIPLAYLPNRWSGLVAENLLNSLSEALRQDALAHIQQRLRAT